MGDRPLRIAIALDGSMRFVYRDDARALMETGLARIERASHVEPDGTRWTADMGPVGGPVLGPFDERQQALEAELAWLDRHLASATHEGSKS